MSKEGNERILKNLYGHDFLWLFALKHVIRPMFPVSLKRHRTTSKVEHCLREFLSNEEIRSGLGQEYLEWILKKARAVILD